MDDIITVAYSDASLFKPRKIDDLVPVAGYVILPPAPADEIPRMGTLRFLNSSPQGYPPLYYSGADFVQTFDVNPVLSTATASMNIGTDPAFLAEVAPTLPATIEGISRSRAGRGPQVWDLLAYYSALLRVESLRVSGRILVRTDGQLPGWVDGSVRISLDVNGENIAPALLEAIRTVEKRVGPIEKETIDGWSNEAERPIRQVIDQERARARRADRAFSSRGVYDL